MLKASNLKAPGFSLGFGMYHPSRAESTPEELSYGCWKHRTYKPQGFSLGFGMYNPLGTESTPEGLSYGF